MTQSKGPITTEELAAATGTKVRVLIVDSGVQLDHPELAGHPIRCWSMQSLWGERERIAEDPGGDTFGHGTAVAGILCEHVPDATIESLKVLGGDLRTSSQRVLAGLQWAIRQGYDVVNCSFGSPSQKFLLGYKTIIDKAYCDNTLLVAACNNQDFTKIEYPGAFPTALSTDFGKMDGLHLERRTGKLVEFVARGDDIRVAWKEGQYRTICGSSFAAPHLAALVVKIRQLRPDWNACQVKAALYEFAEPATEK